MAGEQPLGDVVRNGMLVRKPAGPRLRYEPSFKAGLGRAADLAVFDYTFGRPVSAA
jgi:hypothetical protein